MLIDCHAHLDSYPEDELVQVLERGRSAGVGMVISAGTTLESSRRSVSLNPPKEGVALASWSGKGVLL